MASPLPVLLCPACGAPGGGFFCQRADGENLQICARCETIYRAERPVSLDALYASSAAVEPTEHALEAARWRLGWVLYVCDVLGCSPTPLWDSACGYGDFLTLARGFELAPLGGSDVAPRARWLFEESGRGVLATPWDDMRPARGDGAPPQVIAAWDVLEHLPYPRDVISQWATLLGEEGVLLFATPNADIVHDLPQPAQWSGFNRHFEHLHYMGETGLNALLGGYFEVRFYTSLRQRGEDLLLGIASNRTLTLRQAQLLGAVLEEPALLLDAVRARELGPLGLLGVALLEATAGDPAVAEEAALFAEVSGAPVAASAFVRGVVALKRNRLEAARIDLAVASQSARLREASQGMLVMVLERLLADAETLGEARKAAAIAAEEQRRVDEARALALEAQLAPPAPAGRATGRLSRAAVFRPWEGLRRVAVRVGQAPHVLWAALREGWLARVAPQQRMKRLSLAARDEALQPYLGKRVLVVLPSAPDENWPARWLELGVALAQQHCVVILLEASGPDAFVPVAPGVFVCRGLHLVEDLPAPWLVAREPHHVELLGQFCWAAVIYDAPLPPIAPAATLPQPQPPGPLEPWLAARATLPVRPPATRPRNEGERTGENRVPGWEPEEQVRAHEALLQGAAVVVARTTAAHEAAQALRLDAAWLPDAAEPAFWRFNGESSLAPELVEVGAAQRAIAGCWGPVGDDLDWELVQAVARRLPHWAFVFVGPGVAPPHGQPNVYLLGDRPRDALPPLVAHFTAVFLPVRQEVALQGLSAPVLFSALAAGKPVVTVPTPESEQLRTVRVADTPEDLAAALESARASLGQPAASAARIREAEAHTATRRVQPLLAAMTQFEATARDRAVILTQTPFAASGSDHRAAQFARAWLARGWQVVYVQTGEAGLWQGRRLAPPGLALMGIESGEALLQLASPPRGRYVGVITSAHPLFEPWVEALEAGGAELVYDMVEDGEAYRGPHSLELGTEARLAGLADVLTAPTLGTAAVLEARCGRTVHTVPDGVDRQLFDRRRARPRPPDLPSGRPLLLYVGALWDTIFNWRLLQAVVEAYPSASIVLVGEYADQCPYAVPAHLHILGSRARSALAAYLQAADVVFFPLVCRPGQTPPRPAEVLAAISLGKPVVTAAYGEHVSWPGLTVASDASGFVASIARALENPLDVSVADALATANSWEQRLDALLELVFPPLTSVVEAAELGSGALLDDALSGAPSLLLEESAPPLAEASASSQEDLRPPVADVPPPAHDELRPSLGDVPDAKSP